jgi:hypothetical protein
VWRSSHTTIIHPTVEEADEEETLVDDESAKDEEEEMELDSDTTVKRSKLKKGKGTIRLIIRSRAFL